MAMNLFWTVALLCASAYLIQSEQMALTFKAVFTSDEGILSAVALFLSFVTTIVVAWFINTAIPKTPPKTSTQPEATEPEAPAAEAEPETPAAPLFTPLGEETPEEDLAVETVEEVAAEDVDDLMSDNVANKLVVVAAGAGAGKQGIIKLGVISAAYQAGETVDLASLQEKGMIDGNVGRLTVLASGILDKPLTIKADAFSVQAVKMITLAGGQTIELKGE